MRGLIVRAAGYLKLPDAVYLIDKASYSSGYLKPPFRQKF